VKSVALIIALLMAFTALTIPAHATTYEITFTLKEDGETFWTEKMSVEATNNKTILVPIGLYNVTKLWFASDTFNTSFTLKFPINNSTLEVTSDPERLTIIFQPMLPGDVDGNGIVDIYDLVSVARFFGGRSLFYDLSFEFTFKIDIYDLVIIAINFGRKY
jgi:hypothetical protein